MCSDIIVAIMTSKFHHLDHWLVGWLVKLRFVKSVFRTNSMDVNKMSVPFVLSWCECCTHVER